MAVPSDGMALAMMRLLKGQEEQQSAVKLKRTNTDGKNEISSKRARKERADVVEVCHSSLAGSWEHERKLNRVATQAVVKLFNAVHKQQKKVESTERKSSKGLQSLDKSSFIDMLQSTGCKGSEPSWSVLRTDYKMIDNELRE